MTTMIKALTVLMLLFVTVKGHAGNEDLYFIFYATIDGKTGHVGIAIDNYRVVVKATKLEGENPTMVYDTIKSGTLTYYDLWPAEDNFNSFNVDEDIEAIYYKLPAASWEKDITVSSLLSEGIPHREHYPVDGLIRLFSSASEDASLLQFIETVVANNHPFNVRKFNCADFVQLIIEEKCQCELQAEESIALVFSTTPNMLYKEVLNLEPNMVLRDGSQKAMGSFTVERLVKGNF